MYLHPHISRLSIAERQRDMMARAARLGLARQVRDLAQASRRAEGGGRRRRWRAAAVLGQLLPRYRAVR
jgi:hypothetical protein